MQKDLNNHSTNDLTLLKQKENAYHCTTSTWQGLSKTTTAKRTSKNSTTRLTLKQDGGSSKSRGETCRQLRHPRQTGIKPIGRRAIGILSILQGLTICEKKKISELGPVFGESVAIATENFQRVGSPSRCIAQPTSPLRREFL